MQLRDHQSQQFRVTGLSNPRFPHVHPYGQTRRLEKTSPLAGDQKRPMKCCTHLRKETSVSSVESPCLHIEIWSDCKKSRRCNPRLRSSWLCRLACPR